MSGKFWASVTGKRVSQLIGEYVGQARFWGWGFMGGSKNCLLPPKKKSPLPFTPKKITPCQSKKACPSRFRHISPVDDCQIFLEKFHKSTLLILPPICWNKMFCKNFPMQKVNLLILKLKKYFYLPTKRKPTTKLRRQPKQTNWSARKTILYWKKISIQTRKTKTIQIKDQGDLTCDRYRGIMGNAWVNLGLSL